MVTASYHTSAVQLDVSHFTGVQASTFRIHCFWFFFWLSSRKIVIVLQTRNYGASRRARSARVTPGKHLRHPLDRTRPGFRGNEETKHIHAELWGFSRDTSRKLHTTGTCMLFCWVGTARSFIFSNPGHWVITHNYSMNYTLRVHVERGPLSHVAMVTELAGRRFKLSL